MRYCRHRDTMRHAMRQNSDGTSLKSAVQARNPVPNQSMLTDGRYAPAADGQNVRFLNASSHVSESLRMGVIHEPVMQPSGAEEMVVSLVRRRRWRVAV